MTRLEGPQPHLVEHPPDDQIALGPQVDVTGPDLRGRAFHRLGQSDSVARQQHVGQGDGPVAIGGPERRRRC